MSRNRNRPEARLAARSRSSRSYRLDKKIPTPATSTTTVNRKRPPVSKDSQAAAAPPTASTSITVRVVPLSRISWARKGWLARSLSTRVGEGSTIRSRFQTLRRTMPAIPNQPIRDQRKNGLPPSPHHGKSATTAAVERIRPSGPNEVGPCRQRDVRRVGVGRPT